MKQEKAKRGREAANGERRKIPLFFLIFTFIRTVDQIPISILERTERTLSLPSVIIYRYFFYRQWASCVKFLCACAKEPRYFPDRGIDRSTDCELTRAARPTPGKIARGATQLRGFDPRAPRPDPAGDGEQAAALRNISLCYSALFPCRPVSLDFFLSSSTCFYYILVALLNDYTINL